MKIFNSVAYVGQGSRLEIDGGVSLDRSSVIEEVLPENPPETETSK